MIPEPEQPLPPADSSEVLQRALRDAEERLAYFERIGPFLEQQMAAAAERAAKVVRDTEQQEDELARELLRLREEFDTLGRERDRREEEASAIVAQAQAEAARILIQARHAIDSVLASTLAQLELVQKELLSDLPPSRLAGEGEGGGLPLQSAEKVTAQRAREEEPAAATPEAAPAVSARGAAEEEEAASGAPARAAGPPITRLSVHTPVTRDSLLRFQLALQAQAGIVGTSVQRLDADSFELAVAHRPDVVVLSALRIIPDLNFAVVAEAEGTLEIELHKPEPATSP